MIFTLILTRTLTPNEFGTWNLINNMILYVIISESVISYWVTREIARGIDSGKTAVVSSGLFSAGGIFGYILLAFFLQQTNVNNNVLFFASILVPVSFLNRTLSAINYGYKPHAVSYGALAIGVIQIPLALIFVSSLNFGILGVIYATLFATTGSMMVQIIYARNKIKNAVKKKYLKKWLTHFWVPLYPGIGYIVHFFDITIFSAIVGSMEGVALWSASLVVPSLIINSASISKAVYPKLLETDKKEYLQENLVQLFYFAIPLTAISLSFGKPALFVLNPIYVVAFPVVIFSSIYIFLNTIGIVFQSFLIGMEKVDLNEKASFKDYVKSKLFFIPTLQLIQNIIYISLLAIGLLLLKPLSSQLDLVLYWAIISLVTQVPFTMYLYMLVKRNLNLTLEFKSIFKYLLISVGVFGMTYLLTEHFLDYKKNIFEFLPELLLFVTLGIGFYLTITYFVDSRTKKLFKAILEEIKNKTF